MIIDIPAYSVEKGLEYKWKEGYKIEVKVDADAAVIISANKEGLISLANHLLNLAQEGVPSGCHLHFDEYNSLEEGSVEIIIEKIIDAG